MLAISANTCSPCRVAREVTHTTFHTPPSNRRSHPPYAPHVPDSIKRARIATVFLFFANGLALSSLTPRLADLQGQLNMTDISLGLVLTAGAAGGLLLGPLAAPGIHRFGSGKFSVISLFIMLPLLPLVGVAPTALTLAVVMFGLGAADAVMDAAQNAQGLEVQRIYKRSIINNMHAFWALGTVVGATVGALTLAFDFSLAWTLTGVAVASAIGALITSRWLLPKSLTWAQAEDLADDHLTQVDPGSLAPIEKVRVWKLPRITALPLAALGTFIAMVVIVEDVPPRWSSIYLTDTGAAAGIAGFGVVAFTVSLTIGRFLGDSFVNKFGERAVAQVSMAVVAIALSTALFVGNGIGFIIACAVVGLGVATLFPAAMHAATYIPGISAGTAITIISWLSRAGFTISPLLVGVISQYVGIQWGIGIAVLAALLIIPLARFLRAKHD